MSATARISPASISSTAQAPPTCRFCNAAGGKAGYNDIRIIGCELSKYYQPICWNNKTSVLNGLTVSGNTFTDCIHNHVQVTNKINSGKFVFENNRLVNVGNNKFIRIEKLQDGSAVTIKGTKIENAGVNNNIVRIDGVSSNFTVDASDNQWAKGFFPLWEASAGAVLACIHLLISRVAANR